MQHKIYLRIASAIAQSMLPQNQILNRNIQRLHLNCVHYPNFELVFRLTYHAVNTDTRSMHLSAYFSKFITFGADCSGGA